MNRNAFKVPLLNREGVIDSNVLKINFPSTIDVSFLDIIKANPNAQYKYNNNTFALQEIKDNKYYFIRFFQGTWTETQTGNFFDPYDGYNFVFNLPTEYSKDNYNIECFDTINWETGEPGVFEYTGNDPTITKAGKKLTVTITSDNGFWFGGVTISTKEDFVLHGESLILTKNENTVTTSQSIYPLQGGSSIAVDVSLNANSTSPVQNKVITNALSNLSNIYQEKKNRPYISAPSILNRSDSEGRGGLYNYCANIRSTDTLYAAFLSCQKGAKRTLYDRKKRRIKDDNGELINFSTANIGELYNITKSEIDDDNNLPEAEDWTVVEDYDILPTYIYNKVSSPFTQTPLKVWSCSYQDGLRHTKKPYIIGNGSYLRWYWALAETDEFNLLYLYRCVLFYVDDLLYFVIYKGTKLLQR